MFVTQHAPAARGWRWWGRGRRCKCPTWSNTPTRTSSGWHWPWWGPRPSCLGRWSSWLRTHSAAGAVHCLHHQLFVQPCRTPETRPCCLINALLTTDCLAEWNECFESWVRTSLGFSTPTGVSKWQIWFTNVWIRFRVGCWESMCVRGYCDNLYSYISNLCNFT